MPDRNGIFAGDDPVAMVRSWLAEAEASEPNDPNAIALATVDAEGMPNARMVLLKEIEDDAFVFYTNLGSAKARELDVGGKVAFVMHWKSLRRQIRVRGTVSHEDGPQADAYYASRSPASRIGAWASRQSEPVASREVLEAAVERAKAEQGEDPARPPFWGGIRIRPVEIEFWADGPARLHDRFRWRRGGNPPGGTANWEVARLNP